MGGKLAGADPQPRKELQDRIAESRRVFGERDRIQRRASVMAQIDRAVEMVPAGGNQPRHQPVLNRAQILGVTNEFDLTPAVVDDINKVLASVLIPPDGVSPVAMQAKEGATPASAQTGAQPAAAPAKPPPTGSPAAQQQRR